MTSKTEQLAKSRLGRILVNRGYITEDQLGHALTLQATENKLLGEVLIEQGLITAKDLKRTLKQQSRYRYAAAFVALAAAPFQPMIAMAASPIGLPISETKIDLASVNMGSFGGLQMLDDEEMSGVNAQGFGGPVPGVDLGMNFGKNGDSVAAGLQHKYSDNEEFDEFEEQDDEQIAYELSDSVLTMAGIGPISKLLDANVTVEGMKYQEGRSQIELLTDGRVKFYMPTEIARISMEDIRVKGDSDGATFGNIYMSDIKFHPNSSYTISAK